MSGPNEVSDRVSAHSGSGSEVFVGEALDLHDDGPTVTYDFEVREVFHGSIGEAVAVSTASESSACGSTFRIGDEYILFADRTGDGEFRVNSCSATTSASDRTTRDAAVQAYGSPEVLISDPAPISAAMWLSVAGLACVAVAVGGALLLGRRPR